MATPPARSSLRREGNRKNGIFALRRMSMVRSLNQIFLVAIVLNVALALLPGHEVRSQTRKVLDDAAAIRDGLVAYRRVNGRYPDGRTRFGEAPAELATWLPDTPFARKDVRYRLWAPGGNGGLMVLSVGSDEILTGVVDGWDGPTVRGDKWVFLLFEPRGQLSR